jgi:SAM-dependent methyltransferase
MSNPFASDSMAAGYAAARPPVHPRVLELVRREWGPRTFRRALDVGCGAGLSTRPLLELAARVIGIDPEPGMVRAACHTVPGACFLAGAAEALPLATASVDLITAAGALNYARLECFFPEAARVLARDGLLAVYDFSPGRSFRGSAALDDWFERFVERYPFRAGEARALSPAILAREAAGFRLLRGADFEIGVPLDPGFYLEYMLTETNVANAVGSGTPAGEIREWCAATLAPVFGGATRDVLFRGYTATLMPTSPG